MCSLQEGLGIDERVYRAEVIWLVMLASANFTQSIPQPPSPTWISLKVILVSLYDIVRWGDYRRGELLPESAYAKWETPGATGTQERACAVVPTTIRIGAKLLAGLLKEERVEQHELFRFSNEFDCGSVAAPIHVDRWMVLLRLYFRWSLMRDSE